LALCVSEPYEKALGNMLFEFEEFACKPGAYDASKSATHHFDCLEQKLLEVHRKEAKLQRLLRACENVVLEMNLPSLASNLVVQYYDRLLSIELGSLSNR